MQPPSYQKWKQKQKIDDRDSEEEGTSDRRGPEQRGGKRGRGQGKSPGRVVLKTQAAKYYFWSTRVLGPLGAAWVLQRVTDEGGQGVKKK